MNLKIENEWPGDPNEDTSNDQVRFSDNELIKIQRFRVISHTCLLGEAFGLEAIFPMLVTSHFRLVIWLDVFNVSSCKSSKHHV